MSDKLPVEDAPRLEDYQRAFAQVGEFFFRWATLETQIGEAIELMMGFDLLPAAILNANLPLGGKLGVLRTAGDVYGRTLGEAWLERFHKTMEEIGELAWSRRNLFAHAPFGLKGDGIKFVRIQAKKGLKFPHVELSAADLKKLYEQIERLTDSVAALTAEVSKSGVEPGSLAAAITSPHPGGIFGLPPEALDKLADDLSKITPTEDGA